MPLIQRREAELLRERLRALIHLPVRIDLFLRPEIEHFRTADRGGCGPQARQLLEELAALCEQLELRVRPLPEEARLAHALGVAEAPAIILSGAARGRVRYVGAPLGNEITNLLEDLVDVSRGATDLPEHVREKLSGLAAPIHLELFVTPDCPYCPSIARLVHKLAVESEWIAADVIEADEFPELSKRYGLRAVPSLFVDGRMAIAGARPDWLFVDEMLRASRREGGRVIARS